MRQNESIWRSIWILWGLVITLLILNMVLLFMLNHARLSAIESLGQAETVLNQFSEEVIVYNVVLNQVVPVKVNVPINQTVQVPVNTVIPIDRQLQVPFEVMGNKTIVDVPLKVDFPIETVIPVDFNKTISVDTVIEFNTTVPIEIAIAKTPLANYLQEVRRDIAQLKNRLSLQ